MPNVLIRLSRGETALAFEFPEEGASEGAVRIRQRDHHKTFPRPDMERVLFHAPATIRRRRDRQFFIAMCEITLVVLEAIDLHLHRLSHNGEVDIDAGPLGIEVDAPVRVSLCCFDDSRVERAASD